MNQRSHQDWESLFEQIPADVMPNKALEKELRARVLVAFEESLAASPPLNNVFRTAGEKLMRYRAPHWTAAAMLIGCFIWLSQSGRTAFAFERIAESVAGAKTAQFNMEVTVQDQPPQKMKAYFLEPGRFRQEIDGGHVNVSDWGEGKIVGLDPGNMRATVFNLVGLSDEKKEQIRKSGNQFEAMRELLTKASTDPNIKVEKLGPKVIDGKATQGFRVQNGTSPMTVWADEKSNLPVRIEATMAGPPQTAVVMTNYRFNVDLDESLFSLEIPQGYTVSENDMDVSPADENDFLESLRTACEVSDGTFPDSLDLVGLSVLAGKYVKKMDLGKEGPNKEQMKAIIELTRGLNFVTRLPAWSEAHYAGRGAKLNGSDRVIFWYRPDGEQQYRVVHADLEVSVSAEPPDVPGAKRVAPPKP